MASKYIVRLVKFHIDNTRARGDDTDYVTLNARVNQQPIQTQTKFVGDVNNGDHPVDIQVGPFEVGPSDSLLFNYVILNKGHTNGDRDKVEAALSTAAASALGTVLPGGSLWAIVGQGIGELIKLSDPDCDGVVAADKITLSGTDAEHYTAEISEYTEPRKYTGTDSPSGCGTNSLYEVTWALTKIQETSPRLDVLVHLQQLGDKTFHEDEFAGTRGQSRRLEGFQLAIDPPIPGLSLEYMAHVEQQGDTPWVSGGSFVGTRGRGRRIEGFAIRLTGPAATNFNVEYMAHVQDIGDTPIVQNGEFCGTRGQSRRVEGMLVRLVPKAR